MSVRDEGPRSVRQRWLLVGAACLTVVLLPVSGVAAAEEPTAGAGNSASEAETQDGATSDDSMPEDSAGGVEVVHHAGSDQYELSLAVAQALVDADGGTSEWVVLASGESWADAATAGPLAASLAAPVVLVPPGGLQSPTARPDLVEFLRSTGVRRVVIVGSSDVLPNHEPSVLFGLGMLPRNIERVHGDDPVGTSVAIAEGIGVPAELGELGRTVIIASDQNVADAVAVGPLAATGPFPLLLTAPDELDARITLYLTEREIEHVVLVGGTTAIGRAAQETIEAGGATVTRLAGRDRSDTARLAADLFHQHTAEDPACAGDSFRIGLASAERPEQVLTVGALLAKQCTSLRYIESGRFPDDLRNTLYLEQQRSRGIELFVFGDESVIAGAALDVSLPPTQLAFVSVGDVTENGMRSTQIAVVDEHGAIRLFPQTEIEIPAWPHLNSDGVCRLRELDWSPAGRFLSYRRLCTAEIFVLDTETGESYQVVSEGAELVFEDPADTGVGWSVGNMGPSWSPDGSSFMFTAFIDDPSTVGTWQGNPLHFAELFVHDAESRTTERLTENTAHDLVGRWSPDSNAVTTMQHWDPAASDPYYRSVRSYSSIRVNEAAVASRLALCSSGPGAVWSPDGSHLAYYLRDGWWTRQVAVCTGNGTNRRQLTPIGCSECEEGHQHYGAWILGWNPSGSMLAFSDTDYVQEDGMFDYKSETTADYVLDLESGEIRKLLEFTQESNSPTPLVFFGWSPEGDGLLYLRRSEDGSSYRDLVLLDDVTGNITTLRDIPLLRLSFGRQIQPRLLLSPDQNQLLLIYDGSWPRDAQPRRDGGMWLTSLQSGDLAPLIDFGPVVSVAEGDTPGVRRPARAAWRCETEWSANGISGICN